MHYKLRITINKIVSNKYRSEIGQKSSVLTVKGVKGIVTAIVAC